MEPHTGDHVVQFYDDDAALIEGAGGYLSDGDTAKIVIAGEAHREAFDAKLGGDVVWLDAATTLASFMRHGRIDREAFFEVIGGVVRQAHATGRPVRAFGEMVALLWEAGDVGSAIELEALWNELATQVPFGLYCAYRSQSVAGHSQADALERVCQLHSAVEQTWEFAAAHQAPGEAREVLVGGLRRRGHDDAFLHDVRLIVTELAANAVVHARSPFSVSLSDRGSIVRIRVGDQSPVAPAMRDTSRTRSSGRGLRMISALATRWGVDYTPGGKVVWVELIAPE
jgi:anti-sigma regulatory factor (Ser/Thr protein kinase)